MTLAAMGAGGFYQQLQPNRKILAYGSALAAATKVYTVPLRTQTEVTSIHFDNTDLANQTLTLSVAVNGGTAYAFHAETLAAAIPSAADETLAGMRIMLGPQSELWITTSKDNAFGYLITGIEWTLPGGGATA